MIRGTTARTIFNLPIETSQISVAYVDTANDGTGSSWSLADGYTLGVDYGYKE